MYDSVADIVTAVVQSAALRPVACPALREGVLVVV